MGTNGLDEYPVIRTVILVTKNFLTAYKPAYIPSGFFQRFSNNGSLVFGHMYPKREDPYIHIYNYRLRKYYSMLFVALNDKPIAAQCPRCGYEWTYKGKNPFFASCPLCKTTVKLRKVNL